MEFKEFKVALQVQVANMLKGQEALFITDTDKEILWNKYLDSFPFGTNEIFRERREFDCSCCRHFIESFGSVVAITDNKLINIWDFQTNDGKYQPVISALSEYVKSLLIKDVFVTKESSFGTDQNHEQIDGLVHTWHHFRINLPKTFVSTSSKSIGDLTGRYRDVRNVFKRSLEEISKDAVETVLELIAQKSLYKGEEWQSVLNQFLALYNEYHMLPSDQLENYCWAKSVQVGGTIGKIKNHSIGVLLTDISEGMDLNEAVKRYKKIVAPTNYKRPKAIFTKKMIEQAQKTITELGFLDSLGRRYATIDDITVNNILFANKDITKKLGGDVFSELQQEASSNHKKFDKVEEVPIETFVNDILPKVSNIEILLENRHTPNFMSVIAPKDKGSKTMFKWDNGFSWTYNGNITDSMKERVKALGGNVDGVLRCTGQWNEKFDNQNDFDIHVIEPNGNEIYFPNKRQKHPSSGMLDVDIINPGQEVAVENIIYTDLTKMPEGIYDFFMYVYSYRGGQSGFAAEVEFDNQINSFEYRKDVRQGEKVPIAKIKYAHAEGFKIIKSLDSSSSLKTIWNLNSNQFHPVSTLMYSPNYWNGQNGNGMGHRHYFFILQGCKNEDRPNGFFNEFLREDLLEHKRVFEALGSKMKVESSDDQLSGLGFSSTKRNSLVCKLEGNFTRMIKVIF